MPRSSGRSLLRGLALGLAAIATLGAASCTSTVIIVECDAGEERCDDVCVDTRDDPENCGACGERCLEELCVDGACAVDPCANGACDCPETLERCGDECVDVFNDTRHCGACDSPCFEDETCGRATCLADCPCGQCDVEELPAGEAVVSGSTAGADFSTEPSCVTGTGGDVAYRFIAPATDTWTFETTGTPFDTVLSLLSSCEEVACNDDTVEGITSRVSASMVEGEEILVVVDTYAPGSEGGFTLTVRRGSACQGLTLCDGSCVDTLSDPLNCGTCGLRCEFDESCLGGSCECTGPSCDGCEPDVELGSDVPIDLFGSTLGQPDALQPACVDVPGPEVVHRFVVPFSSFYTIDLAGSSFDSVLSLRDAGTCSEVACNDDFEGTNARLDLDLFEGQELLVVVDGYDASGDYHLRIDAAFEGEPPPDGP